MRQKPFLVTQDQIIGALIVRNLMDNQTASALRDCIDRGLESPVRLGKVGNQEGAPDPWFRRSPLIATGAQGPARVRGGDLSPQSGSIWGVDAPMAAADLIAFYDRLGLRDILAAYFNEEALLSVRKWVLRCVPAMKGGNKGWHQDGRFMGADIRTVNLWIALSDCGSDMAAPELQLVRSSSQVVLDSWDGQTTGHFNGISLKNKEYSYTLSSYVVKVEGTPKSVAEISIAKDDENIASLKCDSSQHIFDNLALFLH